MEPIKDLGVKFISNKSKCKKRLGLYICETCNKEFERVIQDMKKLTTWNCKTCSNKNRATHGDSNTRLYYIWCDMKARCLNPNHKNYRLYGGAGVIIQKEWISNYSKFKKWAMSNGYTDKLTLDKDILSKKLNINPPMYSEKTCSWRSYSEQNTIAIRAKNSTGYFGVSKEKRTGKYTSKLNHNKKNIFFGTFKTPFEAMMAREEYIIENKLLNTRNLPC